MRVTDLTFMVDINLLPEGMSAEEFLAKFNKLPKKVLDAMPIEFEQKEVDYVLLQSKTKSELIEMVQELQDSNQYANERRKLLTERLGQVNSFLKDRTDEVKKLNDKNQELIRNLRQVTRMNDSLHDDFKRVDGYHKLSLLEEGGQLRKALKETNTKLNDTARSLYDMRKLAKEFSRELFEKDSGLLCFARFNKRVNDINNVFIP